MVRGVKESTPEDPEARLRYKTRREKNNESAKKHRDRTRKEAEDCKKYKEENEKLKLELEQKNTRLKDMEREIDMFRRLFLAPERGQISVHRQQQCNGHCRTTGAEPCFYPRTESHSLLSDRLESTTLSPPASKYSQQLLHNGISDQVPPVFYVSTNQQHHPQPFSGFSRVSANDYVPGYTTLPDQSTLDSNLQNLLASYGVTPKHARPVSEIPSSQYTFEGPTPPLERMAGQLTEDQLRTILRDLQVSQSVVSSLRTNQSDCFPTADNPFMMQL